MLAISANSAFGHVLVIAQRVKLWRNGNIVVTRLTKWDTLILNQVALDNVWFKGVGHESLSLIVESMVYNWGCYRSLARMLTVVCCGSLESTVASFSVPIISCLLKFQILTQSCVEIDLLLVRLVSEYIIQSFRKVNGLKLR